MKVYVVEFGGYSGEKGSEMKRFLGEEVLLLTDGTPFQGFDATAWALKHIAEYGSIDGEHHKTWILDQVARILLGTPVELRIARWDNGESEYRFSTYHESSAAYDQWAAANEPWDTGYAP